MIYKENFNPGFEELTLDDLGEAVITDIKFKIIEEINAEFTRLGVSEQQQEYLCHSQVGTKKLEMLPDFNLMMFRGYLRRLVVGGS